MLINFEFENFRSFSSPTRFHTLQRNYKRFKNHIYKFSEDLGILKITGIYGGNASGKTNLFKAMYFVQGFVLKRDFIKSKASSFYDKFLLNGTDNSPISRFSVDFIANDKIYNFFIEINGDDSKVLMERLTLYENENEKILVERTLGKKGEQRLKLEHSRMSRLAGTIADILPSSTSALGFDLFHSDKRIKDAADWFKDKLKFLFPVYEFKDIAYILSRRDDYLKLANRIIRFSETGINKLRIATIPVEIYLGSEKRDQIETIGKKLEQSDYHPFLDSEGNHCTAVKDDDGRINVLKLTTIHIDKDGKEISFELDQESRGTKVLLHLLPSLILTYGEGVTYFIDEINTSLHPILLKELLTQYLRYNAGRANGQIIFNSHEDFIIDENYLRQDELWLMERSDDGESLLFPLSDFPNIRHDLSWKKNYLNGKFGGVPFKEKPEKLDFSNELG